MAKNTKIFSYEAVTRYMENCNTIVDIDVIEGCLLDTFVLYHESGIEEVFEEAYLNEWSSGYARHIYRKGLPKRFITAINEQYKIWEA